MIGLPNHDHRGREWETEIEGPHSIYRKAGRYPSSLFSALKIVGIKHKRPAIYKKLACILSISDWAQFKLCGVVGYEHSQASETLLYDIARKEWSDELCGIFKIDKRFLPNLQASGKVLGAILGEYSKELNISPDTVVVVGGADTQLAIKSTRPALEDIVIVSGTTTPVVKIVTEYIVDESERTWTNRHLDADSFILEANAGVTGLNYQRLKEIFYPNEPYSTIEKELAEVSESNCVASLGSLIANEKTPLTKGGFLFSAPVSNQLSRACFVKATLWDIACCIKGNFDSLCDVIEFRLDYVWACGGGFQSQVLSQFVANLIGKKVMIRQGYQQASVVGGALVCNEALGIEATIDGTVQVIHPKPSLNDLVMYKEWKKVREEFQQHLMEEQSA
jgi:autoinducer 2 (AI-2) kinase